MPKTYKTEIIGYTFAELNEDIQQIIYENDDYFSESVDLSPIEDGFRETLMERFGADRDTLEVYYDVSYSQGSGACCVGELDVATVLRTLADSYFATLLEMIHTGKVEIDEINVVRCGPSNYYNHENTCMVEIEYVNNPTEVDGWDIVLAEELEELLTNSIREALLDFHSKLQDHYEESTSFETYCAVEDSDNVYTKNGHVVDPTFIKNSFIIDGYQLSLDFCEDDPDFD